MKDNASYYDEFAKSYEDRRGAGYHAWLDDAQANLVRRHASGGRLLEVGCGTGLILERLRHDFDEVVGVDLSEGMLGASPGAWLDGRAKQRRAASRSRTHRSIWCAASRCSRTSKGSAAPRWRWRVCSSLAVC